MIVKCVIRYPEEGLNYNWWYKVTDAKIKSVNIGGHIYYRPYVRVVNATSGDDCGWHLAYNFYTTDTEQPLENVIVDEIYKNII